MKIAETTRLIIRKYKETDWKDLYEYLSDPEVVKYEPYEVFSEKEAKKEAVDRAALDCFFAVCSKEDNKLIGNIYLRKGDFDTWELGYVFNSRFQGYGFATEATKALVSISFDEWGAKRVIAMCNPLNTKSWQLLERLGMRREGTLLKNVYFKCDEEGNPLWSDTYEYGILKEEWKKIQMSISPVHKDSTQQNIEIVKVGVGEKEILRNLMEKYDYEFSQYDNRDVNQLGLFGYDYFDCYWTEAGRHPFFIKVNGNLAGFVMVGNYMEIFKDAQYSMSEFFVMFKYRKRGVGRYAAYKVFDMFQGVWELKRHPHNIGSVAFWDSVISDYTNGNFTKIESCADAEYDDGVYGDAFKFSTEK